MGLNGRPERIITNPARSDSLDKGRMPLGKRVLQILPEKVTFEIQTISAIS